MARCKQVQRVSTTNDKTIIKYLQKVISEKIESMIQITYLYKEKQRTSVSSAITHMQIIFSR